jgi:uroporphyrinogen decarboxylase
MSAMTFRERVIAAFNHQLADVVPVHQMGFGTLQAYVEQSPFDTADELLDAWGVGSGRMGFSDPGWTGSKKIDNEGAALDVFGCPPDAYAMPYTDGTPRALAHAETIADVDAYDWPDANNHDFAPLRERMENETNCLHLWGQWQPVFCRLSALFGMERVMLLLSENPKVIEAALAHLDAYYTVFYQKLVDECGHCVDAVGYGDDFAGQTNLLIRPDQWRKYFKPLWVKWFAIAKSKDLPVWMHSCGAIREVLPDLVDAGLDIWETVQAHLPGNEPVALKRDFGKHLTFAGGVNMQHIGSFAHPDQVRDHVVERIRVLGRGGGYICGPCHTVMPEVPFENIDTLHKTILEFREEGYTL